MSDILHNLNTRRSKVITYLSKFVNYKSAINYELRIERYLRHHNLDYDKFIYEIVGGFEKANTKEDRCKLIRDLENNKTGWDVFVYDKYRAERKRLMDFEPTISDCEYRCRNPRCLSQKCYLESKQTRSNDEGMTNFVICSKCSKRYRLG